MKHRRVKRKLTNKQATIIVISVLCAAALLIGLLVILGPVLGGNNADPHAGHNHGSSDLGGGHYEGDGHDHGSHGATSTAKVKYQLYTNADKTFRLVFRDDKGAVLMEQDKLPKQPFRETVDEKNGVYTLAWATDDGPNDFVQVYYNEKTGQVSQAFTAPRGTDGVRVAYGSADQKKMIVQDLFNKDAYYKEYVLENAVEKNGDIIIGGKLQVDKKTVVISYHSSASESAAHTTVKLYE